MTKSASMDNRRARRPRAAAQHVAGRLRSLAAAALALASDAASAARRPDPAPHGAGTPVTVYPHYHGLLGLRHVPGRSDTFELALEPFTLRVSPRVFVLLLALAQGDGRDPIPTEDLLTDIRILAADYTWRGKPCWTDPNPATVYRLVADLRKRLRGMHLEECLIETHQRGTAGYTLHARAIFKDLPARER
ncbi:MAG: hypothetical protein KA248_01975 [Kiritimatiellae bacterium]|nr:hypothetical protein [Kiritimatiellia bacterium]